MPTFNWATSIQENILIGLSRLVSKCQNVLFQTLNVNMIIDNNIIHIDHSINVLIRGCMFIKHSGLPPYGPYQLLYNFVGSAKPAPKRLFKVIQGLMQSAN